MSDLTWDDVPNTDAKASVSRLRHVTDVLAIRVEQASVRLATVSGWFEVADVPNPFTYEKGWLQVQVKCNWYGIKPRTTYIYVSLPGKWEMLENYSSDIVLNLG